MKAALDTGVTYLTLERLALEVRTEAHLQAMRGPPPAEVRQVVDDLPDVLTLWQASIRGMRCRDDANCMNDVTASYERLGLTGYRNPHPGRWYGPPSESRFATTPGGSSAGT